MLTKHIFPSISAGAFQLPEILRLGAAAVPETLRLSWAKKKGVWAKKELREESGQRMQKCKELECRQRCNFAGQRNFCGQRSNFDGQRKLNHLSGREAINADQADECGPGPWAVEAWPARTGRLGCNRQGASQKAHVIFLAPVCPEQN